MVVFGAGAAAMIFGPPERHQDAVALTIAFCVGCAAIIVYALIASSQDESRKAWEQNRYESIGSRLFQFSPSWPAQSVDLSKLKSAVRRGKIFYLRDDHGRVAFHSQIDGFDEIMSRVSVPIERRSAFVVHLLGTAMITAVIGTGLLFEFRPSNVNTLLFMTLLVVPTAISTTIALARAFQRKSEKEK